LIPFVAPFLRTGARHLSCAGVSAIRNRIRMARTSLLRMRVRARKLFRRGVRTQSQEIDRHFAPQAMLDSISRRPDSLSICLDGGHHNEYRCGPEGYTGLERVRTVPDSSRL